MAPSRRAFLAAAAATMAAACSNQATRSDASASTTPTHPVPSTTPTTAGRVGTHATDVNGKPATVVFAGPRTRRQVALTFHLSGDPALVSRLLDTAAQADVPISLFAVGRRLAEHPALVQRILADGHELDNHTWSHFVMTGPSVHRVQAGRRRGRTLPDATAPAAVLAATLLGLILVGAVPGAVLRRADPTGLVDRSVEFFVVGHRQAWLNAMMRPVTDLAPLRSWCRSSRPPGSRSHPAMPPTPPPSTGCSLCCSPARVGGGSGWPP